MSNNSFAVFGDTISITRPEWDFVAYATVREDYLDEIQSVTWGLKNNRYPYNSKLGTLHSYVMKKWYGEDFCEEMKQHGFVIDHMDNVSSNCCIDNLCFLSNAYNKAKGFTFDQENIDKRYIALTMSKDFNTDLYQISIVFNYPATLNPECFDKPAIVELAYLLYEGDYRQVIIEAENILLDYKNNYTFNPDKLRAIDFHIEGSIGTASSPEAYENYLSGQHGHSVVYFDRKAPLPDWTRETKENYFTITDHQKGVVYKLKTQ